MRIYQAVLAASVLLAVSASAGEKKLMHCFAWTPIKEATAADWEAFYKASDDLPKKIKGVTHVWYGKLAAPLSQIQAVKLDAETTKKLRAGETVSGDLRRVVREYGMCMEMAGADALKAYESDPYHKVWADAYAKVRVEGTTTYNILGQ